MLLRLLLLLAFAAPGLRATSVVAPTFSELVAEADTIFRGRVTAVVARRVQRPDTPDVLIKTYVTFTVERVLKGRAGPTITLEFLGGTVGADRLEVSGMPVFRRDGRDLVFVQKNGSQFCPLVALGHGRYRVEPDAAGARDIVVRDNGVPLADPAEIVLPLTAVPAPLRTAATARALSVETFETHVVAALAKLGVKPVQD
jgi:hypothetical protein